MYVCMYVCMYVETTCAVLGLCLIWRRSGDKRGAADHVSVLLWYAIEGPSPYHHHRTTRLP